MQVALHSHAALYALWLFSLRRYLTFKLQFSNLYNVDTNANSKLVREVNEIIYGVNSQSFLYLEYFAIVDLII